MPKMKKMRIPLTVLFSILIFGLSASAEETSYTQKMFGSEANKKIVEKPGKVFISRIELDETAKFTATSSLGKSLEFQNYKESSKSEVGVSKVAGVIKALLDPKMKEPLSGSKGCLLKFGVRIDYISNGRTITANLCFSCSTIAFSEKGKCIGGGPFDSVNKALKNEVKKLFPKDKVIQKL
jgi:hypothetical protein